MLQGESVSPRRTALGVTAPTPGDSGLMGESATERHVLGLLSALDSIFQERRIVSKEGAAVAAATAAYSQ